MLGLELIHISKPGKCWLIVNTRHLERDVIEGLFEIQMFTFEETLPNVVFLTMVFFSVSKDFIYHPDKCFTYNIDILSFVMIFFLHDGLSVTVIWYTAILRQQDMHE